MAGCKNDVSSFIPKSQGLVFTAGYNDEQCIVSGDFTNGYDGIEIELPRYSPDGQRVTQTDIFSGSIKSIKFSDTIKNAYMQNSSMEYVDLYDSQCKTFLFAGCERLKAVRFPSKMTSIPQNAFEKCTAMESIVIPVNVTEIGKNAFEGCTSLKKMKFPENISTIDDGAFKDCSSLSSITFSSYVAINESAFENCTSLKKVNLSQGTRISDKAFMGCTSLEKVHVNTLGGIGEGSFRNCENLSLITLEYGVTSIGDYSFYDTDFETIFIPNSVEYVGVNAFMSKNKNAVICFEGRKSKIKFAKGWNPDELTVRWNVKRSELI